MSVECAEKGVEAAVMSLFSYALAGVRSSHCCETDSYTRCQTLTESSELYASSLIGARVKDSHGFLLLAFCPASGSEILPLLGKSVEKVLFSFKQITE